MQYIWSHKVFVFLRLLQIIKGEMRWRTSGCARARTYTQSVSCSFKLRSLTHSLSRGGIEREKEEECEHCGVLGDSENIQFRLRPDSRCWSPTSFWTLLPFGAAQETLKLGYWNQVRVETTRCPPSSWKDSAAYDCGVCSVVIVVLGGAEGKKRNVRRRSHGTRSLVHKQDAVVKSWTVFNLTPRLKNVTARPKTQERMLCE